MSISALVWAKQGKFGSPQKKLLMMCLAEAMNGHTGVCNPSVQRLAQECEVSTRTIMRTLKELEEDGVLDVDRATDDSGRRLKNHYRFIGFNPSDRLSSGEDDPCDTGGKNHVTTVSPTNKPEVEPEGKKETVPVSQKRGARIPKDWSLSEEGFEYAYRKGLCHPRIQLEAEKFYNFWISKTGQNATKLDWDATWRNWVLNCIKRQQRSIPSRPSRTDKALEALARAANR